MYDYLENLRPVILVSLGAIAGAICRINLINLFALNHVSNIKSIFTINTIANFLLGVFIGLQNNYSSIEDSKSLYLLLCIGFLGCFSTFSALVNELYVFFKNYQWAEFISYIMCSIVFGLLFALLGYSVSNA